MKNPDKLLIPSRDFVPISFRDDEPEQYISFALLIHVLLHLDHRSAVDSRQ